MSKVLILDANHRSALAATRSLGAKGIHVVTADETSQTLAGSSKHCKESFLYPSPYVSPKEFVADLCRQSQRRGISVILPMTEISTYLLLKHREAFSEVTIPFVDFEKFDMLTNKFLLFKMAQQLNVSMPETHFIEKYEDLTDIYPKLKFPVVMKPYRSRILLNNNWINAVVKYASSIKDIEDNIEQYEFFNHHPFLLQEYIHGKGQGLFALYDQSEPVAFFSHRRLREKPPSGGVSVLSQSVAVEPRLYDMGRRILDHAKWHGVAMVEFKVADDGTPYLMEVNARFWGSLQLAIDAGVDFPWLLYQLSQGKRLESIPEYAIGVKNRWLLGDWAALCMLLLNRKTAVSVSYREKWRAMVEFLRFFQADTRYEVNQWRDLGPFLFEVKRYVWRKTQGNRA